MIGATWLSHVLVRMITKTKAYKKGTCPICSEPYVKGSHAYKDMDKPEKDRYVHSMCYENLLWNRTKDADPAPF